MKKIYKGNNFTAVFTDENGHFSLTGDVDGGSGAIGDKLVKIDPRFKMLNQMHLCTNKTGEPLHALENGYYNWKEDDFNSMTLNKYWMGVLTLKQLDRLHNAPEKIKLDCNGDTVPLTKRDVLEQVYEEVKPQWKDMVFRVRKVAESIPSDLTTINKNTKLDDFDEPEKVEALAELLECHFSIIEENGDDTGIFSAEGKDYLVLTDDEADDMQDQELESYLNDCIYPELPDGMQSYFNEEAWKRDAKMDGRGHSLNRQDGSEEQIEDYFIYRQ